MRLEKDDYFELNDKKYIVIDCTTYLNNYYMFVNELNNNDESTSVFKIYKSYGEGVIEEKDNEILKKLLTIFENKFNLLLDEIDEVL